MPRILLVEDELGAIAALKRALTRSGFELLVATNGADALSMAQTSKPEAVVLSGELQSGESGALLASLRADDPRRPLVLLGGTVPAPEGDRLPRPVDGALLGDHLHRLLSADPPPPLVEAAPPAAQGRPPDEPGDLAARLFGDLEGAPPEPVPPPPPPPHAAQPSDRAPVREPLQAAVRETVRELVPPLPDLPLQGALGAVEAAALIAACHLSRWSGLMRFVQGTTRRSLYWEEGRLCGATSTSADESTDAVGYRRGLLTREQQRIMRGEGALGSRRSALLMVERAFIKPAELFPLVQDRVEEVVYAACGGFDGRYELLSETVPPDERVALSRSPLAVMTESIRRKYLLERLLDRLGGPSTLLRPVGAGRSNLGEFGLSARERRLAQAIDGLRNVEELLFEHGVEPLAGLQILHALVLGRFAEVAVRGLPADVGPDVQLSIDLARVGEKYEQVRSASYFELLGVADDATRYEIEQAYERLAREVHPDRYQSIKDPVVRDRLEEIQRVLAEARDVLTDEGLRADYTRHHRPRA